MRILIVSDSHNNKTALGHAIFREDPDALIHLGDGCDDIPLTLTVPCYQVKGNCDFLNCGFPDSKTIELEGVRIFMTHGYTYNVKNSLTSLYFAASEEGADIAFFGHTHMPYDDIYGGDVTMINPGAISRPPHHYGLLVIKEGKFIYYKRRLF